MKVYGAWMYRSEYLLLTFGIRDKEGNTDYIMTVPTLTPYNSDAWALTEKWWQDVEAAEMAFLRNVTGYKPSDQIRNMVVRNELNILNFSNIIQNNGHN
jgi:hypothetical protein